MWNRIWIGLAGVAAVVLVGVLLGVWLSRHAPAEPVAEEAPPARVRAGDAPVAAADMQDFVPEAPQPRLDGSRGVPAHRVAATQAVPMVSAMDKAPPDVSLSTVAPDEDALREQFEHGQDPNRPSAAVTTSSEGRVATVDLPALAANGNASGQAQNDDPRAWVQALRADLQKCSTQGMVSRVICTEQARWKRCGPNNGWGAIPECPRTGNN